MAPAPPPPRHRRPGVANLSDRVGEYRWQMLDHILTNDENTAAELTLTFAVEADNRLKGRVERTN